MITRCFLTADVRAREQMNETRATREKTSELIFIRTSTNNASIWSSSTRPSFVRATVGHERRARRRIQLNVRENLRAPRARVGIAGFQLIGIALTIEAITPDSCSDARLFT